MARARAFTRAAIWEHAQPGTVELVLVPAVPRALWQHGCVSLAALHEHEDTDSLAALHRQLDERRPLGTQYLLSWARYKQVVVKATVVVYREENPAAVRARVLQRLNLALSPLAGDDSEAWPFGHALTSWHVYKVLSTEPGVRAVDDLQLLADHAPDADVRALAADAFQSSTWYAAADDALFRSLNDGGGWERVCHFGGESISLLRAYPREAAAPTAAGRRPARDEPVSLVVMAAGATLTIECRGCSQSPRRELTVSAR